MHGRPGFLFNQNPVNQILNTSGKILMGLSGMGVVRGIPIWNSVNQVFQTHPEKS